MKKMWKSMRKKTALLLSAALLAGMVAGNGNGLGTVHAAGSTPSVTTFATKDELQKKFDCDGENDTVGLLRFGKNAYDEPQTWYIVGTDTGVAGENIVLFAAEPILGKSESDGTTIEGQVFKTPTDDQRPYEAGWNCQYSGSLPSQVNRNHYGGSDLRAKLQEIAESESYFTKAEQSLMNATPVETLDTLNDVTYTTTDKLYALSIWDVKECPAIYYEYGKKVNEFTEKDKIYAGSENNIVIASNLYSGTISLECYWLRSPASEMYYDSSGYGAAKRQTYYLVATVTNRRNETIGTNACSYTRVVKPAANLNLTNVLFASAAKAASQEPVSGVIVSETPMALRLKETASGKNIGTVGYDEKQGLIVAKKGASARETVSLVVQGNDGTKDWYYSVTVDGSAVVTKEQIKAALSISEVNFADCRIWLETTEDNVSYATAFATELPQAEQVTKTPVTAVDLTGVKPVGGTMLAANAGCTTQGIAAESLAISYTMESDGGYVPAKSDAQWNKTYHAGITLRTALNGNQAYVFADQVAVSVDGVDIGKFSPDTYGRLQVTQNYTTDKRKITGITAPDLQNGGVFSNYYTAADVLTNGGNSELGTYAIATLEETPIILGEIWPMNVEWSLENAGGADYNATPGAVNTFRWTVKPDAYREYDTNNCVMTGTCEITNRAAAPVSITGTDESLYFNGTDIDVSRYFTVDPNAGAATWSLEPGGTGVGTLNGTTLTVTQAGTFLIKVSTAANGIYAAGEKTITLTVSEGGIVSTATDYSGIYDGQSHSITVSVTEPSDAVVTYGTDGSNFAAENPGFTKAGSYAVEYKIEKEGYTAVTGKKTVTIARRNIEIRAEDQTLLWGTAVDPAKYTVSTVSGNDLAAGDSIAGITLTPSTSERTDNGTLAVGSVKIVNAVGEDVTDCYNVLAVPGILKIAHNTTLAPDRIEAVKAKTAYEEGDSLNLEDLTVTAYYADGYSETVTGYTTNASDINMSVPGTKILTVSFTQNGVTRTKDIVLTVEEDSSDDDSDDNDSDIASNSKPQATPQPVQPVTPRRTASPASAGSKEYKVMEGADGTFSIGEDESLTIRVDAELGRFTGVEIDGKEVDTASYTTWSGSTYVKLTKEFLSALTLGGHTVKILFSDGYAITTINIVKSEQQDSVAATPAPTTAPTEEITIPAGNTDTTASQTAESTTSAMSYAAVAMIVIIIICGAALVIVCVVRRKEDN